MLEYFQRKNSDILNGLRGVVCLISDVLVYGATQEEHDENLLAVLHKIQEAGLTLNKEKRVFSKKSIKFWASWLMQMESSLTLTGSQLSTTCLDLQISQS